MDTPTLLLAAMAVLMAFVAWQAHRLRNEGRDVALMAGIAGALGLGSLVSAF